MMLKRLQEKIASHGLREVVAARLRSEGFKVAEDRDYLEALGHKIYEKNAEYRRIVDGLQALKELRHG